MTNKVGQLLRRDDDEPDSSAEVRRHLSWGDTLRAHTRLAVIGKPGSGKTTLLHYTTIRLAEALARDARVPLDELGLTVPLVPLLLPLRELGSYLRESRPRELSGNGPRLLLDCLANYYNSRNLDLPPDFFSRLCEQGRAILLLDGLDEVSRTDERELVSGMVREFAARYRSCRYVVSARVAAYVGAVEIGAGFQICTVEALDKQQQQGFIKNWSGCVHSLIYPKSSAEQVTRMAQEFNTTLWQALTENTGVGELAPNPLLLTVIAIVFFNRRDLPENRAQLYDECVKVLLRGGRGKVDAAGKERAALVMGLDARRALLAAVAYAMHRGGEERKLIERADLEQIIANYLRQRTVSDAEAADLARLFLNELPVHIGLLDEVEQNRFSFSHLSFQEFLAALHIAESIEARWDELLGRYGEVWWREVILLCAGYLSQERSWRFLGRLITCGANPEQRGAALALAADALAELERFKGQGPIRAEIRAAALELLQSEPATVVPAAVRVRCGYALAVVGDPRLGVCDLPPAMVPIPGGTFVIGISEAEHKAIIEAERPNNLADKAKEWYEDAVNSRPVTVAAFELARYPVTNAQYKLFMDAGGYQNNDQPMFWDDARYGIARPNHPVVGVNWYEATAFCVWLTQHLNDGYVYRLPSEAEWEYAARGTARRPYPWGDALPDAERANFNRTHGGTSAVGCFPAGATPVTGLLDMAGNVWEWTQSEYRAYPYNADDGRESGADSAQKRFTLRGASWRDLPFNLRAAYRGRHAPDGRDDLVGLRLARHRA